MGIDDLRLKIEDVRFKTLLFFLFSFFAFQASGQISPSKYFIRFTDRANSPYSLSTPTDFLSARAIARRTAHNIPYSTNDLPVNPQYIDSVISKGAQVLTR